MVRISKRFNFETGSSKNKSKLLETKFKRYHQATKVGRTNEPVGKGSITDLVKYTTDIS